MRQEIDMRFLCPRDVNKMLVQRARSVFWEKWAAEHEYEELKEGVWLEPAPALLRKKVREKRTVKLRNVARKISWKEGGRKRDFSILAGRMQVSVKFATRRKAQKSTGFDTVQNGMKSGGRFWRPSESGSKKRESRRKSGSGKEVSSAPSQ